jgi:hypothetical protein
MTCCHYDTATMTDTPSRRDIDPAVARLMEARPVQIPPEPSLLREPARALVAIGSTVAIVASLLPWAARTKIAGDVSRTGWTGLADGFLIALIAVVMCVVTFNRSAVGSKDPLIRRSPLILGPTALLIWASGLRAMDEEIAFWRHQGYDGAYQPWLFICLAGVLIFATGGLWLGSRRDPKRGQGRGESAAELVRHYVPPAVVIAVQLVSAIGAAIGVGVAILASHLHPLAIVMPLILGTIGAGLIGASLGGRIARHVLGRPDDRHPATPRHSGRY